MLFAAGLGEHREGDMMQEDSLEKVQVWVDGERQQRVQKVCDMLRANATGYVWGLQDAGSASAHIREIPVEWEFPKAYREHCEAYELEHTFSRMSVRDAWESWRAHGLIFPDHRYIEPNPVWAV